jgi:tRNA-2-methylthio-N6-dimethylallyladenosine synthase
MAEEIIPELSTSTDVIVGFPGETEGDFEATLEVVREASFDNAFMFIYSPRPGTAAAEMPDHIAPDVAAERFERLVALQQDISLAKNRALVGRRVALLSEGPSRKDPDMVAARTRGNKLVHVPVRIPAGDFFSAVVERAAPSHLIGRLA